MERPTQQPETLSTKLSPVLGLLLTTIITLLLIAVNARNAISTGEIVHLVSNHRDSVALIVQVMSGLLGFMHVFAIQTTLSLTWRVLLERKAFPLYMVKFMDHLRILTPAISLPLKLLVLLTLLSLIGRAPAALWAGAITPVVLSKASNHQLGLPIYNDARWLYQSDPPSLVNDQGTFVFQPEFGLQGLLLSSAASASPRHNETVIHAKLDKTGYSYVGRSYGVGSSVGLNDEILLLNATDYHYYEVGINPQVVCIYNTSSAISMAPQAQDSNIDQMNRGLDLTIYTFQGSLPNGYPVSVIGAAPGDIAPVQLVAGAQNGQYFMSFGTSGDETNLYRALYQAQCEVTFTPRNYSIDVSVLNRTITVTPLNQPAPAWPPNSTTLANHAIKTISNMATILSATLWTSVFGNAFISNIENVNTAVQGGFLTELNRSVNAQNLVGITDAITSMIDNTLVSTGSAQLLVMKESIETPVLTNTPGIGFGSRIYIYAICAANFLVIFIYLEEMCRTRCWKGLSSFRIDDSAHVVLAASGGGAGIYRSVCRSMSKSANAEVNSNNDVLVRLSSSSQPGMPILVLDEDTPEEKVRMLAT